jgi:SAM-dependent methyltransferase
MPDPARDYLTLMLNQYWFAPPVALWRAIELRTLAAAPFTYPILDLGCGDGLIAEVFFAGEPRVDAGFDPWFDQVRKAPQTGAYRAVQQAYGDAMPYPEAHFATVVSNSVLEHIPALEPVLVESARVLRPGGRFIATVPSDAFRELLEGYRDRMAVDDVDGAEAYAAGVDHMLAHHRYPSPEAWRAMLAEVGLELREARYYIPADVEARWDEANRAYGIHPDGNPLFRWLASPRLRTLGYQRIVKRWVVRRLGQRWREAYEMDVPAGGVGGGLLILAEKVG